LAGGKTVRIKLTTGLIAAAALTFFLLTAGSYTGYGRQQYGGGQNMGTPPGTRIAHIFDPSIGMEYLTMPVPEDWTFQGGIVGWTSCDEIVTNFYRATSPDGLSGAKNLPRFDWAWSDNAPYNPGRQSDCLPYDGPIKAADFLDTIVNLLHLEKVKDMPTAPGNGQNSGNGRGRNNRGLIQTSESARAITKFKINNIQEEEFLDVLIICDYRAYLPPMRGVPNHVCSANVNTVWAPEGKLLETYNMVQNTIRWSFNPAWFQRRAALSAQQTAQLVGQIISNGQAFRQGMDMRFQQHEEFMATMERGRDINTNRFNENMAAKQQMSDDWCDSILGQQKRLDPSTGAVYKTDSGYTYDWVNADGKTHKQSNDINFNPNGMGDGIWTLTRNIR
jgi:hypothetical protein